MKLPGLRALRQRVRRFARWTGSVAYRSIVVPLLDREETEHALDLACQLAAERGARIILVAPAVLEPELPINAHLQEQLVGLRKRLESAAAVAGSYGVGVRQEIVRTRPGSLGEHVARIATERRAELIVVGAPVESRRGFRRAFPRDVLLLARDAPCRVMIATGPVVGDGLRGRPSEVAAPPRWRSTGTRPAPGRV